MVTRGTQLAEKRELYQFIDWNEPYGHWELQRGSHQMRLLE